VATAKLNLGFTELRSPIAGRVSRAMLTLGNLAQADQSVLTSVVSQDPVYVYFQPDEQTFLRYAELARKASVRNRLIRSGGLPLISLSVHRHDELHQQPGRPGDRHDQFASRGAESRSHIHSRLYARVQLEGSATHGHTD